MGNAASAASVAEAAGVASAAAVVPNGSNNLLSINGKTVADGSGYIKNQESVSLTMVRPFTVFSLFISLPSLYLIKRPCFFFYVK